MLNIYKIIDKTKAFKLEQKILLSIIFVLLLAVILQSIVVISLLTQKVYRISIPPKLNFGAVVRTDHINPLEVYNFAGTFMQQLNLWGAGQKDFKNNIYKFNSYITPQYRDYLLKQYKNLLQLGQLTNVERSLQPIITYQEDSVRKESYGWLVRIDFKHQEHIANKRHKNFNIRHFIKVIPRDIDPEKNPFGLQIDVPSVKPARLKQ